MALCDGYGVPAMKDLRERDRAVSANRKQDAAPPSAAASTPDAPVIVLDDEPGQGSPEPERPFVRRAADAVVACADPGQLRDRARLIASRLENEGFCVVGGWDTGVDVLTAVVRQFGRPQIHPGTDGHGVDDITPARLQRIDATSARTTPATEGPHLQGIVAEGDRVRRLDPPALVALQCVQQSANGGSTILLDGEQILRDLVLDDPSHARLLLRPGCVSFVQDDQAAVDVAVFERRSATRYRIRFRYDDGLYAAHWARTSLDHLERTYLTEPEYALRVRLDRGQILLWDNSRMLVADGGRPGATANRFLRRVWIADETDPAILTRMGQGTRPAAPEKAPYRILGGPSSAYAATLQLGIPVGPDLEHALRLLTRDPA